MYSFSDVQAFAFIALAVYAGSMATVLTLAVYGAWDTRRQRRRNARG